ncbi:MAG: lipocalin-like domain-containing protein [Hyphomicrobiales bacterium]|nr:lipocalin-like domain-containing protein [Hyphomicrobiales bacterium]
MSTHPLVGAWRYVDATLAGRSTRPNGKGMLYYAPTGEMICQVFPGTVVGKAGAKPTPEEALAALDGTIAYFGTYSIDQKAQTVTHHRQGSVQPGDSADLVRHYIIDGDDLTLNPPGTDYKVHWRRIG